MRILFVSDKPRGGFSAYSKQGDGICTRLVKMGHQVAYLPMGRANRMVDIAIDGVLVLVSGLHPFNEDVIHVQYSKWNADCWILLKETWILPSPPHGPIGMALAFLPFGIVDHEPLSPAITSRICTAQKVICPSRHGQRLISQAGIETEYVPHAISCSDFNILEDKKADCKRLWLRSFTKKPEDDFTVLHVGRNQIRKMQPRMLRGYARFLENNPDAKKHSHLLLWTDVRGSSQAMAEESALMGFATQGIDLMPEIVNLDITDNVIIPSAELISRGVADWAGPDYNYGEDMAKLYNCADILLNATGGECVSLPQIEAAASGCVGITTDYAGGAEHIGPGLTVRWDDYVVMGTPGHRYVLPSIDGIADAIEKLYNADREKLGRRARKWALRFDWESVMDSYWRPFLEELEVETRPKVTKAGVVKWD